MYRSRALNWQKKLATARVALFQKRILKIECVWNNQGPTIETFRSSYSAKKPEGVQLRPKMVFTELKTSEKPICWKKISFNRLKNRFFLFVTGKISKPSFWEFFLRKSLSFLYFCKQNKNIRKRPTVPKNAEEGALWVFLPSNLLHKIKIKKVMKRLTWRNFGKV